jgi:hypothetical protein
MTERVEVSEAMITAAIAVGKATGALAPNVRHADVRRMLAAGIAEMAEDIRGARFDLLVNTGITKKLARFAGAGQQRGYVHVECEDGQRLHVHANEIEPSGRATR